MSDGDKLKLQHLIMQEKAITKELTAELKLKKSPYSILVLKRELKDNLEDQKRLCKKSEIEDLINKYSEDNEELKEVQL